MSFNQGHLMVASSAADPTISILRAFPGSLKSCFRKAQRAAGKVLLSPRSARASLRCRCAAALSRAWGEPSQQHCMTKHANNLKKKYFRDFFLFEKLSLSTEYAHRPVLSSQFWGVLSRMVLVCVITSPIPCCGIAPAPLL